MTNKSEVKPYARSSSGAIRQNCTCYKTLTKCALIVKMLLPIKISMRRPAALRCNGMNSEKFCSRFRDCGMVRSGRAMGFT